MAVTPATRYAKSGDVHIAYQVVGDGANDLVFVPGWVSHVEYAWEDPSYSDFLKRLVVLLSSHPPRPSGHRAVGPRRRAAHARAADGRRPRGDGCRRIPSAAALFGVSGGRRDVR